MLIFYEEIRPYPTTYGSTIPYGYIFTAEMRLFGVIKPYVFEESSQAVAVDSECGCTNLAVEV